MRLPTTGKRRQETITDSIRGTDVDQVKDSTKLYSAYSGQIMPKILGIQAAKMKEQSVTIKELQATLKDLQGTETSGLGGGAETDTGSSADTGKGMIEQLDAMYAAGQIDHSL